MEEKISWPEAVAALGFFFFLAVVVAGLVSLLVQFRRMKVAAQQDEDLRQLVRRYEHLSENTLDAQQRVAADLAELRTRTAAVEQILRSVE